MLKPGEKRVGGRVKAAEVVAMIRACGGLASCGPLLDFEDVVIEGEFVLDDAQAAVGGPMGAMVFTGCTFEGGRISLRSSHLQRLCLKDTRFTLLDMEDAQVESSLELEGVRGLGEPGADGAAGLCRIKAARTRIDGNVVCKDARLDEGPVRAADDPSRKTERRLYALCLEEADITGSVSCQTSVLLGGLNLTNVDLRGDLWVLNTYLEGRDGPALWLQGAGIGGGVILRREESACGEGAPGRLPGHDRPVDLASVNPDEAALDMLVARVGSLYIENCVIDGQTGGSAWAVNMPGLVLTTSLNIWESRLVGAVRARSATIGGSMQIGRMEVETPTETGSIDLDHARIEGALDVKAVFTGITLHDHIDIRAVDLRTGGPVNLRGEIRTGVDFTGARLGGELRLGARPPGLADGRDEGAENPPHMLRFRAPPGSGEVAAQKLLLKEAALDGGLEMGDVRIALTEPLDAASLDAIHVDAARLPFYRDRVWRLVVTWPMEERTAAMSALARETDGEARITILTGAAATLHAFNSGEDGASRLVLETAEQAAAYAAFFCDEVWGDGGSFRLIRSRDDRAVARFGRRSWAALTRRMRKLDQVARRREGLGGESVSNDAWKSPRTGRWHVVVPMEYGNAVFVAELAVGPDGGIEMMYDEPVAGLDPGLTVAFRNPIRVLPPGTRADAVFAMTPRPRDEFEAPRWTEALRAHIVQNELALEGLGRQPGLTWIDLSGARLSSLEDRGGAAWDGLRPFRLGLAGFTLNRIIDEAGSDRMTPPPRQNLLEKLKWGDLWKRLGPRAGRRLVWLSHQFATPEDRFGHPRTHREDRIPPLDDYSPEPYFEFARVLTQSGHVDDARRVESYSRTLQLKARARRDIHQHGRRLAERAESAVLTLGGYLLHKTSDYFMSMGRAAATFMAVYAIGVAATLTGLGTGVLVQDVSPVASVMISNGGRAEFALPEASGAIAPGDLSCGPSINPFVYPLDLMLPLDLGHKSKCDIRTPVVQAAPGPAWMGAAVQAAADILFGALKLSKALYVLVGWLSLTLVVVTATNVFRRHGGQG